MPASINDETISLLTARIYDTVLAPHMWPTVLQQISGLLNAFGGGLIVRDRQAASSRQLLWAATGHSEECQQQYVDYYRSLDPLPEVLQGRQIGEFVAYDALHDERYRQKRAFQHDFLIPHGIRYVAAACIGSPDDSQGLLGFQRGPEQGEFGGLEMAVLSKLSPHIVKAVQLLCHVQQMQSSQSTGLLGASALDMMEVAVFVVGVSRNIVFANLLGERVMLSGRIGRQKAFETGPRLILHDVDADQRLERAVRRVCQGGEGAFLHTSRPVGEHRQILCVLPLQDTSRYASNGATPLAMVLVSDPRKTRRGAAAQLRALFGLTPAEATLALELAAGRSLNELSEETGRSVDTLRTQLKCVFSKTDTHRQSELVSLLLRLPPVPQATPQSGRGI
ncbi:hypothetical protein [Chitinivorax sp. B]|uniref:helix-turn-helix transcriptional regulator n=1 Tax=Chitinivorax sp. B TaxID=2502235 RepID=UPI0010F720FC|nr:hypothetical protein [Chitinivorax sp. B]